MERREPMGLLIRLRRKTVGSPPCLEIMVHSDMNDLADMEYTKTLSEERGMSKETKQGDCDYR